MPTTTLRPALGYIFLAAGNKSTFIRTPEKITGFTKHRDAIILTAQKHDLKVRRLFVDHNTYRRASPFDQNQFMEAQIAAERDELPLIVANFFQLAARYPWEKAIARISALRNSEVEFIDAACGLPLKMINETMIRVLLSQSNRALTARRLSAHKGAKSAKVTSQKSRSTTKGQPRRQPTTAARTFTADEYALRMSRTIKEERLKLPPEKRGNNTAIANRLNERGLYTRTGRSWNGQQVKRTLERAVEVEEKRKAARKKS